jgi:hypothetical protein
MQPSMTMHGTLMPRHEIWRSEYRARRYARHLSQPELNRRIRDVFLNMLNLTPDAKIGLGPITEESINWMVKWTHVLEELRLRHGPFPAGFTRDILHSEPFPDFASELADKAARRLSSLGLKKGDALIKFGKPEHMADLYEKGKLRLQPASYFAKKDHNGAVRDDELSLDVSLALSRDDIVKVVRNPEDVPADAPDQRFDVRFKSPTDFWLYCVTTSVQPRLFVDFQATACVIIRDQNTFLGLLSDAAMKNLPSATMRHGAAVYVDPLLPKPVAEIFVPFAKPFGYSYQEEHRFCWIPAKPAKQLSYVDVEVGSLQEVADYIVL